MAVSFRALKHLGSNLHSTHSNTLPINSNSLCDISQELRLLDWELQNALVWHVAMLVKSYIPLVPFSMQSMPRAGLFSFTWRAFTSVNVWIGDRPEFSASARGTLSSASEKARNAYCSREEIWQIRMLHVLYINTDQLLTKNNSVSSKFSYFPRNEKCGSHWKGNVISWMNGRDFPHSHHLYYRLSEMTVT